MKKHNILKQFIENYAAQHGMKLMDIARELNITPQTLSNKLSGGRSFSIDEFHNLATLTGTSMDVLYLLLD